MELRQINFKGYQGRIVGVIEAPLKPPLLEIDTNELLFSEQFSLSSHEDLSPEKVRNYFEVAYKMWGKFGPYGDIISIKVLKTKSDCVYYLSFIGRLAFHKPGLATDLLFFIRLQSGNYFVGIKRRFNPGQGKLALPGGFIDVKGYHLETPIETIVHEAEEEIGLRIRVVNSADLFSYMPIKSQVKIAYDGYDFDAELLPLGIMKTGDDENLPTTGLKRVYTTTAYALMLDLTSTAATEASIKNWLKAGDDAAELALVRLNDFPQVEFGVSHHQQLFDGVVRELKNLSML